MSKPTKLRAHHVQYLIEQILRDSGIEKEYEFGIFKREFIEPTYGKDFFDKVFKLFEKVKSDPQARVLVTDRVDAICAFCPYNLDDHCVHSFNEKVIEEDRNIIKKHGIEMGRPYSLPELLRIFG